MAQAHSHDANLYYVPHGSRWPFFGSIAMFVTMVGLAGWFNDLTWGMWTFYTGIALLLAVLTGWFGDVVRESVSGRYNRQVDVSFRMGMIWFIFSEVMFFAAFFGPLFYARQFALPWLSGEGDGALTNWLLWEGYSARLADQRPAAGRRQLPDHSGVGPAAASPTAHREAETAKAHRG